MKREMIAGPRSRTSVSPAYEADMVIRSTRPLKPYSSNVGTAQSTRFRRMEDL